MGLVKTPELYRAGAAYAAATSLPAFVSANEGMFADYGRVGGGGQWNDRKAQEANSPVDHVTRIRVPVFLAHGDDDDRVPVAHSRRMAQALRDAEKDVEYIEFAHEPHGFLSDEDRLHFYERLLDFFEKNLAARPKGSSATTDVVPVAEH
jgi:dipeptidyl aminopeptidase/acylaminoacyl peptidase